MRGGHINVAASCSFSICRLKPPAHLAPCLQIVPNFRVRTIPVLGTTPAIFGLAGAAFILCQLAEAPFTPEPIFRVEVGWKTLVDFLLLSKKSLSSRGIVRVVPAEGVAIHPLAICRVEVGW